MGTLHPEEYGEAAQRYVRAQIRAEIAYRHWPDAEVARKTGLWTSTLSRYLSDTGTGIPFQALVRIAQALEIPVTTLIARAEDRMAEDGITRADPEGTGSPGLAAESSA